MGEHTHLHRKMSITDCQCVSQACHDLVPPDWLQPVMRHLCNQFVHDRARPEEITVGLKTVREICMRMPLIMSEEVLLVTSPWCNPWMLKPVSPPPPPSLTLVSSFLPSYVSTMLCLAYTPILQKRKSDVLTLCGRSAWHLASLRAVVLRVQREQSQGGVLLLKSADMLI